MSEQNAASQTGGFLQERVSYLEESNQRFTSILEMLAASNEFQGDLSRAKDAAGIFNSTISQLRRLFTFQTMGFFENQSDSSFELIATYPDCVTEILNAIVETHMLDGTFAWALNRNQAVLVPIENGETLVLQVVATQSRVRGMFVGTLQGATAALDAPSLNALSLVLYTCAYALESTTLYAMLHDHTQNLEERVKLRTRDLEEARLQAEAASLAKSDFLANMSHEIRTPMNGVMGMTDLMLQGGLTPQKEKMYLRAIKDSADSLMLIVNDILDFSKIEAGKFSLEKVPFSFRDALERCMSGLIVRGEEKGLKIIHQVDSSVPACLIGDSGRLRQVLTNLVGNAIKFCQEGQITIEVGLASLEMDDFTLHVRVTDTGIGITEEACQRIFNKFEQADGSTTRKFGGTGLGLAISKKLVELMGGEIWVESQLGVGSCFHFTAHLLLGNEAMLSADHEAALSISQLHQTPMNILLADDVEINRALVLAVLEPYGHQVTCVEDGRKALEACKYSCFDIVLMDVQMPEMDGLQAARAIRDFERATDRNRSVPIVAMTAFAGSEDRQICIDAGMNDYLTKPIKSGLLVQILSKYSNHTMKHIEETVPEVTTPKVAQQNAQDEQAEAAIFAQNELLERLGGRDEMIPRFVGLFCKGIVPEMEGLAVALAGQDADLIRRHAHAIKGSSANIAALRMNLTAALIEKAAKEDDLADLSQRFDLLQLEYREFIEVAGSMGYLLNP
jgi:signal transduction histidine kinase/CheY-like chemotaxis protein/HPt (histidine-containing phosphotransfer) domain-containing protein